jgi:hypothetical protein
MELMLMEGESLAGRETMLAESHGRPFVEPDNLLDVAQQAVKPFAGGI